MGFGALIIGGVFMLIGWMVNSKLKSKFKEYSQTHLTKDLTGAEIARLMLVSCQLIIVGYSLFSFILAS